MITLKQFRRKPINNDPRGTPVLIQHGMHSLDVKPTPEEMAEIKKQSQSKPASQKKKVNEAYAAPDWNPEYNFNKDMYSAVPGVGHAYQFGMAREVARMPDIYGAKNEINERFKLENHHLIPHLNPSRLHSYHYEDQEHALMQEYGQTKQSLHPEISRYTEDSSYLNRNLWQHFLNTGSDYEDNSLGEHNLKSLDEALQSRQLPTKLTVFAGVKYNPGLEAAKNSYNRLYHPGYTSSSIEPGTGLEFSARVKRGRVKEDNFGDDPGDRHILKIHLPAGHPGEFIGTRSHFDHEKEFLIPRQTTFQIMPHPTIVRANRGKFGPRLGIDHIHFWDAHPVLNPSQLELPLGRGRR